MMTNSRSRVDVYDHSRKFAMVPHDVIESVQDGNAIALYAILKKYADGDGKSHPSMRRLAEALGYTSYRPLRQAFDKLRAVGLVRTFPRYRDADGIVSYEKSDRFNIQTSNGYVIYDTIDTHRGYKKDRGAVPYGTPPQCEMEPPRGAYRTHELEPVELEPVELDNTHAQNVGSRTKGSQTHNLSERESRSDRFDEFWDAYPRKVGKKKARAKFAAAVKAAGDAQRVIDGAQRLAADPNLPEKQFIPHPTTWLERGGWDDEPLPARSLPRQVPQRKSEAEQWDDVRRELRQQREVRNQATIVDGEVLDQQEIEQ
ncbi:MULTISPECIES: helix-turn-helix domain-containing protein [unclassified Corynebacterium]|uniref:helix-turn-helix domain-containing protein n=1 Tax=unclassified Corynebacterium TaxID=2624378 RepID=UPI00298EC395|nr:MULTISPECIES: helix-turn-helix domain-containing protein [unclassified Corynebacterium]